MPEDASVKPPGIAPQPPGEQEMSHRPPIQRHAGKKSDSFEESVIPISYGDALESDGAVISSKKDLDFDHRRSGELKSGAAPVAPEAVSLEESEGCPAPLLCTKNCFVYINEHGCQDCQCLWQALACEEDDDCPESAQFCELGKCNCRSGFRQDMAISGACERDPDFKEELQNELQEPPRRLKRDSRIQESSGEHVILLPHLRRRLRSGVFR